MAQIAQRARPQFRSYVSAIVKGLKTEIVQQGHRASGSLAASIEATYPGDNDLELFAQILANDYWVFVDSGVAASRIPYTPGQGRGGTSKYIGALIDWAKIVRPGIGDKGAKSFAFAIAAKHAREGMPTRGSYQYSANGRRKNFVQETANTFENKFEEYFDFEGAGEAILELFKT